MNSQIDLHELRDKAINYIDLHGAGKIRGQVRMVDLRAHLGITGEEFTALYLLLHTEGLAKTDGRDEHVYLTERGRDVVQRDKRSKEQVPAPTIHASDHSIVQYATGVNNSQTATLSASHVHIQSVLDEIEREIPKLPLDDTKRGEAKGLLSDLRKMLQAKVSAGVMIVLANTLSAVLTSAGSDLGQRLIEALENLLRG
jgi:hypothetical protein